MNRKYIDFVPKTKIESSEPVVKMPNPAEISLDLDGSVRSVRRRGMADIVRPRKATPATPVVEEEVAENEELEMMTVEDILIEDSQDDKETENKRFGGKKPKMDDKALSKAAEEADDLDKSLKVPKTPGFGMLPKAKFVNTEKVDKRPLSKNVYQKKVVAPKEEPQGPVTIIARPEKDSKMGLVVTIVITIVLGAAAGTVAFLLLPK